MLVYGHTLVPSPPAQILTDPPVSPGILALDPFAPDPVEPTQPSLPFGSGIVTQQLPGGSASDPSTPISNVFDQPKRGWIVLLFVAFYFAGGFK